MIPNGMKFKHVKQLRLTEFSGKKNNINKNKNKNKKQKQLTADGQIFH